MGFRALATIGVAGTMLVAVLVGTLGVLGAGPVASAATTTVPNPDPALITEWKPCQPDAGVTEFVDYGPLGSGKVDVGCAPTAAAQTNGFKALTAAGFTHATRPGTPGFLTTITGCPGKTCPVVGTIPSGAYWSYWLAKAPGDAWGYSDYGGAAPETNGTAYPFQAWAYGNSTLPRVPVMDSTGPVTATPAPAPTSAQALALAEHWVTTAFSHLAAQCVAHSDACGQSQFSDMDDYVQALIAAGVPTDQIDPTVLALLRSSQVKKAMATEAPTFILIGGLTTENGAVPLLSALAALHTSGDTTEIDTLVTRIQETLQPTGCYPLSVRLTPTTHKPTTNYPTPTTPTTPTLPAVSPGAEAPIVGALLAAGAAVPVTAVDSVVGYVVPALGTKTTKGTTHGVKELSQQIVGLVTILKAAPAKITGGTVTQTEVSSKIVADASALAGAQKADGGFNGGYAGGGGSQKLETAYATGQAGQGLAVAAQALRTGTAQASARAASRWLASMQLTPAAVGIGGGSADLGFVASTSDLFVADAANGLGYDPATLKYYLNTRTHQANGLMDNTLWDIDHAMLDWSLAPYTDATIATPSATTTATTATITASVNAGTNPQTVSVDYGTTPALAASTLTAGSVAVPATATKAVAVTLAGLSTDTTYYYRVVTTSPVKPDSKDTETVTSTIESFTTAFDVTPGATANLTSAVGYLTSPAKLVNSTYYAPYAPTFPTATVGLTIDGAFALAATKTADPTLAMITTWVAKNADGYTGVGTANVYGGALGKVALLAEVTGQDPHTFGGHNLIAALDQAVCTAASSSCVAAGNYTTSSSVFDQALGIMAQLRSGDTTGAASPIAYLESLQKGNGAWSGLIPASSTTTVDSTAMAVMALALTSSNTAKLAVQAGLDWIVTQQQGDGGFLGASGINVNSTALAVMAMGLSSFYGTQIAAAESFLAAEQNHDGGFTTAVGTTTGSNLRASTQAVNGVVGTSFGTLSDPLTGPTPPAPTPTSPTTPSATSGYWEAASDGGIFAFGDAQFYGSMGGKALNAPVVGIAATPNGQGYWEVASDGGVFAFGTAQFYGSEGGQRLNAPIVGIAATPDGKGYWEVAADGGVFAFGDAAFYGSTGAMTLNAPVVGITATPTGGGYWEVGADGGVYAFGNAQFYGSMDGTSLDKPVVAIASTPNGQGYWEVAADGGVFAFGDAGFSGSLPTQGVHVSNVVSVTPTADGQGAASNGAASGGYWEVAADGGIFSFGDAVFSGSMGGQRLNAPIVGVAAIGSS